MREQGDDDAGDGKAREESEAVATEDDHSSLSS